MHSVIRTHTSGEIRLVALPDGGDRGITLPMSRHEDDDSIVRASFGHICAPSPIVWTLIPFRLPDSGYEDDEPLSRDMDRILTSIVHALLCTPR